MLSRIVARTLPWMPRSLVGSVARRYIAGEDLAVARATVASLRDEGFRATVDILGEDVTEAAGADRTVEDDCAPVDAIETWEAPPDEVTISCKPPQFGLRFDPDGCRERLATVIRRAWERELFVRLDMEDSSATDVIVDLYRHIAAERGEPVGVVLQAMLFCTRGDGAALADCPDPDVRLCKGIDIEPPELAWRELEGVRENLMAVARVLLEAGVNVCMATDDRVLIEQARALCAELDMPPEQMEFQALLGVPILETPAELRDVGHPVRLYVPYGSSWYAYSVRRLRENPSVVGHVVRVMLSRQR